MLGGFLKYPLFAITLGISSIALAQAVYDVGGIGGLPVAISSDGGTVAGSATVDTSTQAFRWTLSGGLQILGTLTGTGVSFAYGTSANGNAVVGESSSSTPYTHAFIWTSTGGMSDLGILPGGTTSFASSVSADGSVVTGAADNSLGFYRAFKWTQANGMLDIDPGNVYVQSFAYAVSADGSAIAGDGNTTLGPYQVFRWTQSDGMIAIPTLAGYTGSSTRAVSNIISADGNVLAGTMEGGPGGTIQAFRWTPTSGSVGLGVLGTGVNSTSSAISADGSAVVGSSATIGGTMIHAFRWTNSLGMQDLGILGANAESEAWAVSANGSSVVGRSQYTSGGNFAAFLWTPSNGMRDLNSVMTGLGVDLTGIYLRSAEGISDDGSVIIVKGDGGDKIYVVFLTGGVLTPISISESIASLEGLANVMVSDVGNSLMQQARYNTMPAHKTRLATSTQDWSKYAAKAYKEQYPWWVYISGMGGLSSYKIEGEGSVGLVWQANDTLRLGGGPIIGAKDIDLSHDGDADIVSVGGGLFMALEPQRYNGAKLYASAYGRHLDANIDRGYLNGASNDQSHGETSGREFGFSAEAGWGFNLDMAGLQSDEVLTLTPFLGIDYSRATLDGYHETSGGFLATFDELTYRRTLLSAGARLDYTTGDDISFWGSAAFVHNASDDKFRLKGSIDGLGGFDTTVDIENYDRNWIEPAVGATLKLNEDAYLSGYLLGRIRDKSEAILGLTLNFRM